MSDYQTIVDQQQIRITNGRTVADSIQDNNGENTCVSISIPNSVIGQGWELKSSTTAQSEHARKDSNSTSKSSTASSDNNTNFAAHTGGSVSKLQIPKIVYLPNGGTTQSEAGMIMVLVYVDDMMITDSSLELIEKTKLKLQQAFKMKDLGELKYFLGIEFTRSAEGILMHHRKYALELIAEVGMSAAKPAGTPIDVNVKLTSKQRSVTDYVVKIGKSLVSWKAKKQTIVSKSSAEAEYRSLASTVSELIWLLGLLAF
uniref:Reverse transcriptase Ty1/copia-type domain-containing protein n=1 Tax=Solanum lycopersicum TaxID=4081 RepID=A0A3Q7GKM3_SOLLC